MVGQEPWALGVGAGGHWQGQDCLVQGPWAHLCDGCLVCESHGCGAWGNPVTSPGSLGPPVWWVLVCKSGSWLPGLGPWAHLCSGCWVLEPWRQERGSNRVRFARLGSLGSSARNGPPQWKDGVVDGLPRSTQRYDSLVGAFRRHLCCVFECLSKRPKRLEMSSRNKILSPPVSNCFGCIVPRLVSHCWKKSSQ